MSKKQKKQDQDQPWVIEKNHLKAWYCSSNVRVDVFIEGDKMYVTNCFYDVQESRSRTTSLTSVPIDVVRSLLKDENK